MNTFVDIIATKTKKDKEGFVTQTDTVIASIRAYREDRHANMKWANLAAFSSATVMFKFRKIPGFECVSSFIIQCSNERFKIISVEDVKGKGMYVVVLAEKIEPTKR